MEKSKLTLDRYAAARAHNKLVFENKERVRTQNSGLSWEEKIEKVEFMRKSLKSWNVTPKKVIK